MRELCNSVHPKAPMRERWKPRKTRKLKQQAFSQLGYINSKNIKFIRRLNKNVTECPFLNMTQITRLINEIKKNLPKRKQRSRQHIRRLPPCPHRWLHVPGGRRLHGVHQKGMC